MTYEQLINDLQMLADNEGFNFGEHIKFLSEKLNDEKAVQKLISEIDDLSFNSQFINIDQAE